MSGTNALVGLVVGTVARRRRQLRCSCRFRLLNEMVSPLAVAVNAIPIIVLVAVFNNMFADHERDAAAADGDAHRVSSSVFVNVAKGLRAGRRRPTSS